MKNLKTFCPLPWMHLSLDSNGQPRLCCNSSYPEREVIDENGQPISIDQTENLTSIFNLPFYKTIRRQMLENKKPSACSTCYAAEKYGGPSLRGLFNQHYKNSINQFLSNTEKDGSLKKINIKYLDLPLGNLCNLRCRMCHPNLSVGLAKDFDYLKIAYNKENIKNQGKWIKNPVLYEKLSPFLKTAEEIFFTGGEPLLIKEHETILNLAVKLRSAKNIRIKYNSNITKLNSRLISLWREFREVEFNCSIDGFGSVNNYIRFPSKWSVIERALWTLDEFSDQNPHIKVYIHSVFQALNLFNIPELLKWLARAKWRHIYRAPHFIWLHEPKHLRSSVLPENLREKAINGIEKALKETSAVFMSYNKGHHDWTKRQLNSLSHFLERLKREPWREIEFKSFVDYTSKMDQFRKQDITQFIPEFKEFFHTVPKN